MEFKLVVGNVSSYLSADPGVVTYLEGPLHTQQPPHWAIRSAAAIALLFKVGAIVLGLVSVVLLSYLGIMMSWGLAFGLPWTLAYFYFIWICPAHQLTMGIRCYLKPEQIKAPFLNLQKAETLSDAVVGRLDRLPHRVAGHRARLHHHHLLLIPSH